MKNSWGLHLRMEGITFHFVGTRIQIRFAWKIPLKNTSGLYYGYDNHFWINSEHSPFQKQIYLEDKYLLNPYSKWGKGFPLSLRPVVLFSHLRRERWDKIIIKVAFQRYGPNDILDFNHKVKCASPYKHPTTTSTGLQCNSSVLKVKKIVIYGFNLRRNS